MKLPVCEICAYTNNLCQECKRKLKTGEITEADVELSRILYSLAKHRNLKDLVVDRTIYVDNLLLILVEDNPGLLIGRKGITIKRISEEIGYKIRVIHSRKPLKDQLLDLVWPIPITGVNEVFSSEGDYLKIRIPKQYANRLPFPKEIIERAASKLAGKESRIVFE